MKKIYTKKLPNRKAVDPAKRKVYRFSGFFLLLTGLSILAYTSIPLFVWKIFYSKVFASVTSPVPSPFILTPDLIRAIEEEHTKKTMSFLSLNSETTDNWVLSYHFKTSSAPTIKSYTVSIPELNISHANVSTVDFDVTRHLVQYWGTPIPPLQGNTVIFGHSTLPQLHDNNNYKTIFAYAHKLKAGDNIFVHLNKELYTYKVVKTYTTEPEDLSVLNQYAEGSYITIVTCSPPGTTWKRLIIKAKLQV